MQVVLINPYELGRQPFGLAEPAAWLARDGHQVVCVDLALERLERSVLERADLVGLHLAMHTATRIAVEAMPRIRAAAPHARVFAYGLYAPVNAAMLRDIGIDVVLGGEAEPDIAELARRLAAGDRDWQPAAAVNLSRIPFVVPDRTGLPALTRYARLLMPDGSERVVGFLEATRGCKHLCRHCPVVPVYQGRFRTVPVEVVVADARAQVAAGAEHLSFGDPDFLNGPTHALRVLRAIGRELPGLTFDATVKVEHLLRHREHLAELAAHGCLFLTTAVESVDDAVLERLDKGHTRADFVTAVALAREAGIALAPTFVAFTPWTTLGGYLALLEHLVHLALVEAVPPVQLAIRLLVPAGSRLLELDDFAAMVEPFDPALLGHPWSHPDPRVDALAREVQAIAERAETEGLGRREAFTAVWQAAHRAAGRDAPALPPALGAPIPHHSEPWYCCAEPTSQQLASF